MAGRPDSETDTGTSSSGITFPTTPSADTGTPQQPRTERDWGDGAGDTAPGHRGQGESSRRRRVRETRAWGATLLRATLSATRPVPEAHRSRARPAAREESCAYGDGQRGETRGTAGGQGMMRVIIPGAFGRSAGCRRPTGPTVTRGDRQNISQDAFPRGSGTTVGNLPRRRQSGRRSLGTGTAGAERGGAFRAPPASGDARHWG
jgi:hypothetical protein